MIIFGIQTKIANFLIAILFEYTTITTRSENMKEYIIKISGSLSNIEKFKRSLEDNPIQFEGVKSSIESINIVRKSAFKPRTMGIEPLTYFIVVFAAHLAADQVSDFIKRKLEKRAQEESVDIKIENENGSKNEKSTTPEED